MGKKRKHVWRWRILAFVLLAAMLAGAYLWWQSLGWKPPREAFPVQGVLVGEGDDPLDVTAMHAAGADFVYLEASRGAEGRDASFAANLAALEGRQMPHGAVHAYDPCVPAQEQAANFVTIVPRDPSLLPPAIALDTLASTCGDPVIEAAVESELTTFINQVENHTGQPAVLKLSPEFEERYGIAARIERNLWLTSDRFQPDYAGRPWTLWTANTQMRSGLASSPLRWVVVQP